VKIVKSWDASGREYSVSECVERSATASMHGEGQIESIESNVAALAWIVGVLAEAIVMKRDISRSELDRLIGYEFEVKESEE
jgi:hypothetical protein